jgi:hypothetical protein
VQFYKNQVFTLSLDGFAISSSFALPCSSDGPIIPPALAGIAITTPVGVFPIFSQVCPCFWLESMTQGILCGDYENF